MIFITPIHDSLQANYLFKACPSLKLLEKQNIQFKFR